MAKNKTETLNVRLSADYKHALKAAADREQRSISNLIAYLIAKHCKDIGIPVGLSSSTGTEADKQQSSEAANG